MVFTESLFPPQAEGSSEILYEIVRSCKEIEEVACRFYSGLAIASKSEADAAFWRRTADDEWEFAEYWVQTMSLARRGLLPQIFDKPEAVRDELITIVGKMIEMLSEIDLCAKDQDFALTMAFKIEFFSIHRALVPLINLSKAIGGGGSCPYDKFADHLDSFIAMLRSKRSSIRPEMQLLAETIQRLWEDNLQLSRECYFDELTGLLNRRGFLNSVMPLLNLARRRASTVSITVIDIDFFKKVNDSYGHETGDKVLKAVANVIKNSLRDSDICARYGGEEFVVFYPEIRAGSSAFVSEKIRRAVETADCGGHTVTISVGTYEAIPGREIDCNEELATLFRNADSLLYKAKKLGRNRVECVSACEGQGEMDPTVSRKDVWANAADRE